MARIAGAVLAAGSGTRMGTPKASLVVDGQRLVDHAVQALVDGGCAPVLVVARCGVAVAAARAVVNEDPSRGMRSSLALAVDAAPDVDAMAVLLVDLPGVTSAAVAPVIGAWRPGRIAIATYRGRRGHPTVMAIDLWREALTLAGPDEGARMLLASRPGLVDEIAVAGAPDDLDTPDDLARWTGGG
jgi:CTP:molybdopterin cytidylyltransferase MocA